MSLARFPSGAAISAAASALFLWAGAALAEPPIPSSWAAFKSSKAPPDKALVAQIGKMQWYDACVAWGRATRSGKDRRRRAALISWLAEEQLINGQDVHDVRESLPTVGMSTCGVLAILGHPQDVNRTKTASGQSAQLVYRTRNVYVYTKGKDANGLVTAVQY